METVWRKPRYSAEMAWSWTGCNMSIDYFIDDFIDIGQTLVLAMVAVGQIYTILILRNELSRAAKVLHAMSMAIGEQSDLKRRMEVLEDNVAELTMRG